MLSNYKKNWVYYLEFLILLLVYLNLLVFVLSDREKKIIIKRIQKYNKKHHQIYN